jgi:phosphoenolpyruvate synthase/pyruvate phosphate dikinase
MSGYVVTLQETDQSDIAVVGGKAAHLGALLRMEGIRVPDGFCVTTEAFRRVVADVPSIELQLDGLSRLDPHDHEAIRTLALDIRHTLEDAPIPNDIAAAISDALARSGPQHAYAVRSSATSEDSASASYAGQHDTYLNVVGAKAILEHVAKCWASLFTNRAVTYRIRNGFDHRKVSIAVVVQQMAFPDVSGIMFTADPVTSNRTIVSIEASFGLGEALVSGIVNGDVFKARDKERVATTVSTKRLAVQPRPTGGTQQVTIRSDSQDRIVLSDAQVQRLAQLGRQIEGEFGCPQDVEWCLVADQFHIVQSRPITTLFPIPELAGQGNHVWVSVGHQQMMTDPMKPLGLSFWQLTTPRPMSEAGGRLFVDFTLLLGSPTSRAVILEVMERSDPLIRDALQTVLDRGDFIPMLPDDDRVEVPSIFSSPPIEADPAVVTDLILQNRASVAALRHDIEGKSGSDLIEFIFNDILELKRILFDPRSSQVFMTAMEATHWLNEHLEAWLGEKNVVDTLTQSVPNNVTSEMGLALLDVADVIRPHPDVVAFLRDVKDQSFMEQLRLLDGGQQPYEAIRTFLDTYGMRCPGEIDITRPRWSEQPGALVPTILSNIRNFEPGAGARRFEEGRQQAWQREQEVLEDLRSLPDGAQKADEVKTMIDRVRTFMGYREYPKYGMISRYLVYKQALMQEAERLVEAHVLRQKDDAFYLTLQELDHVVASNRVDQELIATRREAYASYLALTPPRVLTSEGECITGSYQRDGVPSGALVGLPVSSGTVEGRARVILDMAQAELEAGDILVTTFTDPSWTPLFVAIGGLVTEVGGLMTHGAVIAREYGLPAIVGVEGATKLIRDGQQIRLHGSDGYVELLPY